MSRCFGSDTHPSFIFSATAASEIFPLSLHDALPIFEPATRHGEGHLCESRLEGEVVSGEHDFSFKSRDRKSTRLNSSHVSISYAVFCLKKKNRRSANGCRVITASKKSAAPPPATPPT